MNLDSTICSIAALKQRIEELESEKLELDNELTEYQSQILELKKDVLNQEILSKATKNALNMIKESKAIRSQIEAERELNAQLKNELKTAEETLYKLKNNPVTVEKDDKDALRVIQNINEYQKLTAQILKDYFPSTFFKSTLTPNENTSRYDIDLLPTDQRKIVKRLRELPSNYPQQSNQVKHAILQGMVFTLQIADDLIQSICSLKSQQSYSMTPASIETQIIPLTYQLKVIFNELKRFSF
ncbi:hypothetical protein GPJ56_008557 [Histomonas meleagridis]|uniref:uncharacterized protein n=1 Tax=Histomonas meleagridis TaxID=135588 RepID=UPI0035597520|nr:hypothetical protein GPJ56_008557 [Histomonas meleagridis]KAH0798304.1 hypothetical protein GO595_008853 [Histomonas meleagridis]